MERHVWINASVAEARDNKRPDAGTDTPTHLLPVFVTHAAAKGCLAKCLDTMDPHPLANGFAMKNPNCPTDEEIAEQNERKEKIRLVNLALLKASNPHRTYYASVRMEPIHVCIGSGHINSDELDTDE